MAHFCIVDVLGPHSLHANEICVYLLEGYREHLQVPPGTQDSQKALKTSEKTPHLSQPPTISHTHIGLFYTSNSGSNTVPKVMQKIFVQL